MLKTSSSDLQTLGDCCETTSRQNNLERSCHMLEVFPGAIDIVDHSLYAAFEMPKRPLPYGTGCMLSRTILVGTMFFGQIPFESSTF